jgi:hypothetical protein
VDFELANPMPAFRSHLEVLVAQELDHHGVSWDYERPVSLPSQLPLPYLPDFTIDSASEALELPRWIEVKPQQFLYDLRDLLGVTRRHGDRFSGEVIRGEVTAKDLREMLLQELWKPKRLAELTGESVLVIGTVGGTSSLSVEMCVDSIRFSRSHPFVNWLGVQKAKERERKRLQWEAEAAERQRLWQERQQLQCQVAARQLQETLRFRHLGPTRWARACFGCSAFVQAGSGSLRKVLFTDGSHQWRVLCSNCCHR